MAKNIFIYAISIAIIILHKVTILYPSKLNEMPNLVFRSMRAKSFDDLHHINGLFHSIA